MVSSSSMFEWTITNIDPSLFNTFSDLLGQCISGVLIFSLIMIYPLWVYDSLNGGGSNAISLDLLITPPRSIMEIVTYHMFSGTSKSLLLKISFVLLIATLSHPIADLFLKFENHIISERSTWLLSSSTTSTSTPFYSLLGDNINYDRRTISLPVKRLLSRTDYIANGLSRFSLITTKEVETSTSDFKNTIHQVSSQGGYDLDLTIFNLSTSTRSIPLLPTDVECKPFIRKEQEEQVYTLEYYESSSKNNNNKNSTNNVLRLTTNETFVPDCDYENPISISTTLNSKEKEEEAKHDRYWNVQSRMILRKGKSSSSTDDTYKKNFVFGFDNNNNGDGDGGGGNYSEVLELTPEETRHGLDRGIDDWKLGRKIRNNLKYYIGGSNGHTIQVEYSILTSSPIVIVDDDIDDSDDGRRRRQRALYVISSWSYECPTIIIESDGDGITTTTSSSSLSIENYKEKNQRRRGNNPSSDDQDSSSIKVEGCIINMEILCDHRFPEDISDPTRIHNRATGQKCQCQGKLMEVITLQNLDVDETILAVYSGTVLRNNNNGFSYSNSVGSKENNVYYNDNNAVTINSISASYLVTRQVVYGNIPITDVRPVINILYVFFMILPLLIALPLLLCIVYYNHHHKKKKKKQQGITNLPTTSSSIPTNMWEAMVFANRDETTIYKFLGSNRTNNQDPFPPQPIRLMFGMLSKGNSSGSGNTSGSIGSSDTPSSTRRRSKQPKPTAAVYGLGTNFITTSSSSSYSVLSNYYSAAAEVTTTTINYTPDGCVLVNKTPYKVTDPNAIIKKDTIKFPNKKTAVEYGY